MAEVLARAATRVELHGLTYIVNAITPAWGGAFGEGERQRNLISSFSIFSPIKATRPCRRRRGLT